MSVDWGALKHRHKGDVMRFIVRGARTQDLDKIRRLAHQFPLLNLPPDRGEIAERIRVSQASFRGEMDLPKSRYIFVAEDTKNQLVVGCSQIVGKHGTPQNPAYSFKLHTKERFSRELDVGFVHRLLRMKVTTDGPTEMGGLILDPDYRRRPEGVGRLLSLIRFVYIGMFPERFEKKLYAEMAPPLTDNGRSDFWESIGRRFTGMSYKEADRLSRQDKKFISSLFPEDDIYLCLLDPRARLVLGRVGFQTQRAYSLLKKVGFTYNHEVDPFDGGPHLEVLCDEVPLIKNGASYKLKLDQKVSLLQEGYFGMIRSGTFYGGYSSYFVEDNHVFLPEEACKTCHLSASDSVYVTQNP